MDKDWIRDMLTTQSGMYFKCESKSILKSIRSRENEKWPGCLLFAKPFIAPFVVGKTTYGEDFL